MEDVDWVTFLKVVLAAVLGGVVGLEREWHGRPAGLRTNILIAMASCLFTILSVQGFPLHGNAQDTGRVAAQIVSGVGFLGAGALLHNRDKVKGLTTAATVWLVAAVGMTVAVGGYALAIFTTLVATAVLQLLRPVSRQIKEYATEERNTIKSARKRNGNNKPIEKDD